MESRPRPTGAYQRQILEHAGVSSFADWILLLRHLTFYFEDRRTLVWDPSAQRQLLRLLFLSPASSAKWVETERDVLRRDSAMRNLRNVVSSQERTLTDSEQAVSSAADLRSELGALERLQGIDQDKLDELNGQVAELDAAHQEAVLTALKAENQNESAFRDLERRQLAAIAAAFPSSGDTARYLMAQLISEKVCLACGAEAPRAVADLQKRIATQRCVVCDTPVTRASSRAGGSKAIAKATRELERAERRLQSARERQAAAAEELERQIVAIQELSTAVAKRAAQIESLARRLPPDETELHEQRSEVAALRARLETMKKELENRRGQFMRLIKRTSREIVAHKDEIRESFEEYAEGFLLEDCKLIWSPHKDQIGEGGRAIDFPAFELEMGGADFDSPVRREGPQQVSESQREFIDLAFRMALIRVAAIGGVGSIVIDAPESSLDAVFVKRAASVMARYAKEAENRLIVTSNLIEGDLIPELMRKGGIRKASSNRIVDLLKIAAPTAATRAARRPVRRGPRQHPKTRRQSQMSTAAAPLPDVRRQLRVIAILAGAEAAAITPLPARQLHAVGYFADVLAPVWGLQILDPKLLKRSEGPTSPALQADVDRSSAVASFTPAPCATQRTPKVFGGSRPTTP